jgi:putative hydrolase of the HAD superfamily
VKELVTDIFFDLDHTLWDFERNSALTFKKIFELNDLDISLDAFLAVYIPINLEYWKLYREEKISKEALRYQRLKRSMTSLSIDINDTVINTLSEDYITYLPSSNHLFPGTLDILDYLKKSYNLHMITNGFREVQRLKMQSSKIDEYFKVVVDSESVGVKKPNPKIFDFALNEAKVRATNAVMIGDSIEADIQGAQAIGMHTIYFDPNISSTSENNHIKSLMEIKQYL